MGRIWYPMKDLEKLELRKWFTLLSVACVRSFLQIKRLSAIVLHSNLAKFIPEPEKYHCSAIWKGLWPPLRQNTIAAPFGRRNKSFFRLPKNLCTWATGNKGDYPRSSNFLRSFFWYQIRPISILWDAPFKYHCTLGANILTVILHWDLEMSTFIWPA